MSYIVWIETPGMYWTKHDAETLADVLGVIHLAEGDNYVVTRKVEVSLMEKLPRQWPADLTARPGETNV